MNKKEILNCPSLEVENMEQLKDYIIELNEKGIGGYSVAINAEKIMMYNNNKEMKASIDDSLLPSPDGVSVVIGYRWLFGIDTLRVDLPNTILEIANEQHLKIFLLGAKEEVNKKAAENITDKHKSLILAGRQNGFFKDNSEIESKLKEAKPDFIFVCMGSPRQEFLMTKLLKILPNSIFIGCGGALDVMSGHVKRAPMLYQNNGLEWFYRIMQRPSLIKRKWVYVPFMIQLLWSVLKNKFLLEKSTDQTAEK